MRERMDEGSSIPNRESDDVAVDWRGRPSNPNKHGGTRAAAFVLGMYVCHFYYF